MKTLLLLLAFIVTTAQAATVRLYFVDPLTNDKDTNAFYVTPIGTNVLSTGGVVTRGITTRYVPASDGYRTNTLAVGHYSITNRSLGSGVVIRVPDSSSLYDYTNLLISGYNIFVTVTNGSSGTSGALTNNEARAVTLSNGLTVSGTANLPTISGSTASISAITAVTVTASGGISGPGTGLTAIPGGQINTGTISSNKMDATAHVAYANDVTQPGLAAGSYPIAETALTGVFRFSTTNTMNVGSSNAITVVSNVTGWASVTFSGAGAVSRGFDMTFYATGNTNVFTNGTTAGFYMYVSGVAYLAVTNSAHPDAAGDLTDVAGYTYVVGSQYPDINDANWLDNDSDANPITVVSTEFFAYSLDHAKFYGDGSGLVNVPTPSYALTNNWQSGAPQIRITNTVNVGNMSIKEGDIRFNFASPFTNFFILSSNQFKFAGDGTLFGAYKFYWGGSAQSYADWGGDAGSYGFLMRTVNGIGFECPSDNGVIRLTDDHRLDGLVKLAAQSIGGLVFPSNNFSGMLAFQAPVTNGAGTYIPGYAGIRAKNATGVQVQSIDGEGQSQSELWFYTLIPPQLSNSLGGFRSVEDTNWFGIGTTNSFQVKGLTVASNALSQWPTAPYRPGDVMFVNSNGVVFMLGSGTGSTWTTTNKIAP